MRLLELFDKPIPASRTMTPPGKDAEHFRRKIRYRFAINGIDYFTVIEVQSLELLQKEFDVPQQVIDAGGHAMSIDFAIEDMVGGYEWKAFERIGAGTQFQVFATVIKQGMNELKSFPAVRTIHIGVMSEDDARKNLYRKMIKRYFPTAKVIEVPNQPAQGTDYLQTRMFILL